MKIVGIVGKMSSGKNTVANVFEQQCRFLTFSTADPLKQLLQTLFDIPSEVLWGPSELRRGEIRQMLQELGTDFARKYRPDVWVTKLSNRIYSWHLQKTDLLHMYTDGECAAAHGIVVPDIRFHNEANLILTLGGTLLKVVRTNVLIQDTSDNLNHISEKELDDIPDTKFKYIINNNKSLIDLEAEIMGIAREITKNAITTRTK